MSSLIDVELELAERCHGMIQDSNGRLWVRRGKCTPEEQLELWRKWKTALDIYGRRDVFKYAESAAFPGTSLHELPLARAVDIDCEPGFEEMRDLLAKEWGLMAPLVNDPHHFEFDPNQHAISSRLHKVVS